MRLSSATQPSAGCGQSGSSLRCGAARSAGFASSAQLRFRFPHRLSARLAPACLRAGCHSACFRKLMPTRSGNWGQTSLRTLTPLVMLPAVVCLTLSASLRRQPAGNPPSSLHPYPLTGCHSACYRPVGRQAHANPVNSTPRRKPARAMISNCQPALAFA